MKNKFALIALSSLLALPIANADRVRNGGHFTELEFTALAYDLHDALVAARAREKLEIPVDLHRLKRVIATATFRVLGFMPKINGKVRHAVNEPDLLSVEFNEDEFKSAPLRRKYQMIFHELYPLVDIDDTGHHKSIPQVVQLERLGLLNMKKSESDVTPALLESAYDDERREGMSASDVAHLCAQKKELHGETYFVVYCHYIEKSWKEPYKFERRENSHEHWFDRDRKNMPWREVHRYLHSHVKESGLAKVESYGVRIYGIGLTEQLPWRVLIDSQNYGDGFGGRHFRTRFQALESCRTLV